MSMSWRYRTRYTAPIPPPPLHSRLRFRMIAPPDLFVNLPRQIERQARTGLSLYRNLARRHKGISSLTKTKSPRSGRPTRGS